MSHDHHPILDATAVAIAWGSLFKLLPPIAAALSIIYTAMRIWEWIENRRAK